jgi:hypothetical protein
MGTDATATRLDRVLAVEREPHIESLETAEIRLRRAEARHEENDLSYLRRVLHGRIDIIAAEQLRRASGDEHSLLDQLARILADPPPTAARSARHVDVNPGGVPGEYRVRMEALLAADDLSDVLDRSDAELAEARAALADHEAEVSAYRVRVQAVVDRFASELARRYREGQATVDDLLSAEAEDLE